MNLYECRKLLKKAMKMQADLEAALEPKDIKKLRELISAIKAMEKYISVPLKTKFI